MSEQEDAGLDAQRHSMVEALMGIIGSPDDPAVARHADELLQALDVRVRETAARS